MDAKGCAVKKPGLAKDIETCLEQILGDDIRMHGPTRTKVKSGASVYRITGSPYLGYNETDNIVYAKVDPNDFRSEQVEVTLDNYDEVKEKVRSYFSKWEIALLTRGRDRTRKELQDALIKRGHAVEVRVGGGHNNDWYPASIAVEQLSRPATPGEKFDAHKLAGELIAIGESLAPLQKTMDDVSLRLRALGIALTINLKA
jgi:hypothetical protein